MTAASQPRHRVALSADEPLRIAMVCPYSFSERGGVQSHVLGLGGWLTRAGHDVVILAPGRADRDWVASHGLGPHQISSLGQSIAVPYNGSVARVTFGPTTQARVRRWLEQVEPDVIHVHEPITPSASVHAVWARNAPLVATFHTATPGSRTMKVAGQVLAGTIGAIDAGIAVSAAARDVVCHHIGLDPVVIGNGITLPEPMPLERGHGGRPRITFLGRYDEPRKGFATFTRAVDQVRDARRRAGRGDLDVVVVGHGRERHLAGYDFRGRVSDAERDRILASTDVYVAPHVGRESFGIVLLEALAAGAQVVASDLPAFREVLTDDLGPVGTLVPVGRAHELAAGIEHALDQRLDPARGRALAAQFSWDVVAPQILQHYRRVASPASSSRIA